jgi:anti-sigma factor RsiW
VKGEEVMGCSFKSGVAAELVIGYAAGTLDPATAADFEAHLQSCPSCRELAAQQQAVWSSLEDWKPIRVSPDFDQKLFRRIADDPQGARWRQLLPSNWSLGSVLPMAAAAAVLFAAFLLKEPAHFLAPSAESQPQPRIEQQVQRALDDMEMLTQIDADVAVERPSSPEKI